MVKKRPGRRAERLMFRVIKGGLVPADTYTTSRLRDRGYKVGDIVSAELRKPRNPGFHRLVHRIGMLVAANIDAFTGMEPHAVLKRLQWEGNIGCDEMGVQVPGVGMAMVRIPRSLSYESMDQSEFYRVARAFCDHIAQQYWPGMDPEEIEYMAESFVEAA